MTTGGCSADFPKPSDLSRATTRRLERKSPDFWKMALHQAGAQCCGASLWPGGPQRKPAGLPPIWPPRRTPKGFSALRQASLVRVPFPPPLNHSNSLKLRKLIRNAKAKNPKFATKATTLCPALTKLLIVPALQLREQITQHSVWNAPQQ